MEAAPQPFPSLSLVALACRAVGQLLPGSSSLQVWQIPTPPFKEDAYYEQLETK